MTTEDKASAQPNGGPLTAHSHSSDHTPTCHCTERDMRKKTAVVTLLQFLLIAWASVWVAALPLFHTHLPGAFQPPIGVPHTVFSPDLPGEYRAFTHTAASDDASRLSVLATDSPELGFIASLETEDGKRKPHSEDRTILLLPVVRLIDGAPVMAQGPPNVDSNSLSLPRAHGLRAPPSPLSL